MLAPLLALLLAAGVAHSQTFEVASLKVSSPESKRDAGGGPGTKDPGQYHFNRASLLDLVVMAYHVERFQVSSKMPLDKDAFDLAAKVPPGATKEQFREMLQNLLAERFHLKLHRESREFHAYELTVAKGGPKLKESAVDEAAELDTAPKFQADRFPQLAPGRPGYAASFSTVDGYMMARVSAQREGLSVLVQSLHTADDTPIVDRTGLTGKYDFRFEYSKALPGAAAAGSDPPAAEMFTALIQQLGLELVPKKLPFDVIVIESFDRTPAEN